MIREISHGERPAGARQVPRFVKLAMFEGKYGFLLQPVCPITVERIEVNRVRIPDQGRTLLENAYGGQETWQVQVWERAEGVELTAPTWVMTVDPESTYEEALEEAKQVRETYAHWDRAEAVAQMFRPAEPRISLLPPKPPARLHEENRQLAEEMAFDYGVAEQEKAARFKVLGAILPKTVELAQQAEQTSDAGLRRKLEGESLEAYFAENAPGWPELIFKAWQRLNPIGLKWMQWLYVWNARRMKRRKEISATDYELAFNWRWNRYYTLTAPELAERVCAATNERCTSEAIKKRRERLGLTTDLPPGPPPREG